MWKSNLRRVLDSTPSTRRLLDGVTMPVPYRSTGPVHPTHWLISTQVAAHLRSGTPVACLATDGGGRDWGRLGYEVERAADVTPGTTKRGKASFDGAATCYLLRVR